MNEGFLSLRKLIDLEMHKFIKVDGLEAGDTLVIEDDISHYEHLREKKYCNYCNDVETFEFEEKNQSFGSYGSNTFASLSNYNNQIVERCTNCNSKYRYYFRIESQKVIKVGEHPSSLKKVNIKKKYKRFQPQNKLDSLRKAIVLHEFGYHKASMVYLRTCYEYLVDLLLDEKNLSEKKTEKMNVKVRLINEYYPEEFRTDKIYSILSEDVHDYTNIDDENLYIRFNLIYEIMILIYEEIIEKEEMKTKTLELQTLLHSIDY